MKKIKYFVGVLLALIFATPHTNALASAHQFTMSPISQTLDLKPNSTYDLSMALKNVGEDPLEVELKAAPYNVVDYEVSFGEPTEYNQIVDWIRFDSTTFSIRGNSTLDVIYHIDTPNIIPSGGQYAVVLAECSEEPNGNGIINKISLGQVIYAHNSSEQLPAGRITGLTIPQIIFDKENGVSIEITIENSGNIDFMVSAIAKIENIRGEEVDTIDMSLSVLPESTRTLTESYNGRLETGVYFVDLELEILGETTTYKQAIIAW